MKKTTPLHTVAALAACKVTLTGQAPSELRLVPAGHFKARDGRPQTVPAGWHLDAQGAERLIATASARRDASVIDYEHQTLHAETNGQPAPAAGWFDSNKLEWRDDGLYATDVTWTAAAKAAIEAGEYRYLSPVMLFHPRTGDVLDVTMAALTNHAAIDGLDGLSARAAAKFDFTQPSEDSTVNRDELIKLLGLSADATDDTIRSALADHTQQADEVAELKAKLATAENETAALKAKQGDADPAKFVPVTQFEQLKVELAALKTDHTQKEVDALVKQGLEDGKLLAGQEDWARDLGRNDVAALKTYLDKTPQIAALKGQQSGGKPPADDQDKTLSESQVTICKATGIDPADYQKQLDEETA